MWKLIDLIPVLVVDIPDDDSEEEEDDEIKIENESVKIENESANPKIVQTFVPNRRPLQVQLKYFFNSPQWARKFE